MTTVIATSTEMQNNFGRYASIVKNGGEVIVTSNGRVIGRFVPKGADTTPITDSLTGILKGDYDLDAIRNERLRSEHESVD